MSTASADSSRERRWTGTAVPLSAIAGELERLSRRPRAAEVAEGVPALAQARVLNFVVYATSEATLRDVTDLVEHLVVRHPSRTIILLAQPGGNQAILDATISTHTTSREGRQILYEQICIAVHGAASGSLPSIVLPLLLPGLPTYLWWPGDPPVGNPIWRRVVDECDRLILNSAEFSTPLETLSRFAQFYRNARRFHTFGDLNWNQLAQWRELIAQFFDNQGYRPFMDNIQEVTIVHSGAPANGQGNPVCALLLAGWLCARLGWESSGCQALPQTLRYHLRGWPSGRSLLLQIQERPAAWAGATTMLEVRLVARHEDRWATFGIVREDDSEVAHTTVAMDSPVPQTGPRTPAETATGTTRSVSLVSQPLAVLLSRELEYSDQDETFAATLAVAGSLAEQACKAL